MTKHDRGKMGTMPKLVRGERGASILGALIVALMLGAASVATFEFASPSFSSVYPDSQSASPVLAAFGRCDKKIEACNQEGKATDGDVLTQSCKDGFDFVVTEERGVVTVEATPKSTSCSPPGGVTAMGNSVNVAASLAAGSKSPEVKTCGKDKKGKLVPGFLTGDKGQDTGSVKYCAKLSAVGRGGKPTPLKEECLEQKCMAGKNLGDMRAVLQPKAFEKLAQSLTPAELKKFDPKTLGPVDKATSDAWNQALQQPVDQAKKAAYDAAEAAETAKQTAAKLDAIANACDFGGEIDCTKYRSEAEKAKADYEAAEKKSEEELKKLNDLKKLADAKKLEPTKPEEKKPPPGKEVKPPPESKCPPNCPTTFPPPNNRQPEDKPKMTFGEGPWGQQSLGQPKQQPPPGNGVPQAPGTCSPSVVCGNNTLYARNNQCVDQVMQQCTYGCNGNQCAQTPQGCSQQSSPQPDPSLCQAGTWRPTYGGTNNLCVVGWQCSSTGATSGGGPTAQISCQPQVADVGMTLSITYSCSAGTATGSGFSTGDAQSGATTTVLSAPPGGTNTATYSLTCSNEGRTSTKECSVQIAKPSIVLVANPKSVVSGKTSALGWVTAGMQSCVISSVPNTDAARYGFSTTLQHVPSFTSQNANKTSPNGTATTPELAVVNNASTVYGFLLHCTTVGGGTRDATTTIEAKPN